MTQRQIIKFAFNLLRREWRAGDVRALIYATIMAVTSITTVTFFTDRIQQALILQASELLAADLRLRSDASIDPLFFEQAKRLALTTTQYKTFRSMALYQGRPKLIEVKAVGAAYPLRGSLQLEILGKVNRAPKTGTMWIDKALQEQLGVKLNDDIQLGSMTFRIAAIINKEPDRASEMFSIAPRAIISLADVAQTQLIQEGSRVTYYLLLAGSRSEIAAYRKFATEKLSPGDRIEGAKDARNEIRIAMRRAEQFFGLVAVVSLLLSLTAIGIAARRYAERNIKLCAIMRCLGAKQKQINHLFFSQLAMIAIFASSLGVLLGWISHHLIAQLLANLLLVNLPSASYWPVVTGMLLGVLGVMIVALPPVLHLKNIPTLVVLRQAAPLLSVRKFSSYLLGLLLVGASIYWLANDAKMAGILILGIIATLLILALLTWVVLFLLRLLPTQRLQAWGIGVRNLTRNPLRNVTQILAFGVAIMALLLLTMIRGDLLDLWQASVPEDSPNRFIVNIQSSQVASIERFFQQNGKADAALFPIVRARFVAINGKKISDTAGLKNQRSLTAREYKLSWASQLQLDNQVVAGQWWPADTLTPQFSIEQRMATSLGVRLGDELTFSIADISVTAKVTSLRTVQWDSFRPNFYVLTPKGMLSEHPVSYITSTYIAPHETGLMSSLIRIFPNLTVINVSDLIQQIRNITQRVALAVEYMFVLTVITGLVLLLTAIQVSYEQRRQESAVMRALGASRRQIFQAVFAEFFVLGAISGFIAVLFAAITAFVLADRLFQQTYYAGGEYWFWGIFLGASGVALLGRFSLRKIVKDSPVRSLMGSAG
ncbi:MAG: ABC transporter permease [Thiohalomonadales bacterium]